MQMLDDPNFDPSHEPRSATLRTRSELLNADGSPTENILLTAGGQEPFTVCIPML